MRRVSRADKASSELGLLATRSILFNGAGGQFVSRCVEPRSEGAQEPALSLSKGSSLWHFGSHEFLATVG